MNILFLSHIWPPAVDGGSQIVYHSQKQLQKLGHQTLVLTTNCQSTDDFIIPKSLILNHKSSNVIRLSVYKTKLFIYLSKIIKNNLFFLLKTGPILKPLDFFKALIKIKKFKPNLIIAGPFPTTISFYASLITKLTKAKLIIIPCFHHQDLSFQNHLLLSILKKANLIWTLSSYEQLYLSKKLNINKSKFFISLPGINLSPTKKSLPKDITNLLFLGNFAAHKRIELLMSAFTQIKHKYPQITLTIVGQKTLYYPQIIKHLNSLPQNIKKDINLISKKYNQAQLKNYLDKAYIMVNPSIHESFGIVFMESASRGVPTIGSSISTVKSLLTKSQTGLVFKKDNLDSLVKTITTLIEDKVLYNKLSKSGPIFSKKLKWPQIITNLNKSIAQT